MFESPESSAAGVGRCDGKARGTSRGGTTDIGRIFGAVPRWGTLACLLVEARDAAHNQGDWKECVATSRLRPDEETLLQAYNTFYGCGRLGGAGVFAEPRCPLCWAPPPLLNKKTVRCSRYKHGASRKASSGLGRWRGGDARAAAAPDPLHAWALGEGAGEDVEIHTTREPSGGYNEDPGRLTIGRVSCFFDHEGNKRPGVATRPQTSWVLVHDYVTRGPGIQRDTDACTQHPILVLRGRGRPLIYPVSAIRRHVHLYHLCSVAEEGVDNHWTCRPMMTKTKGGGVAEVWKHQYKSASSGITGNDAYLLNEHHHSISQDSFL